MTLQPTWDDVLAWWKEDREKLKAAETRVQVLEAALQQFLDSFHDSPDDARACSSPRCRAAVTALSDAAQMKAQEPAS